MYYDLSFWLLITLSVFIKVCIWTETCYLLGLYVYWETEIRLLLDHLINNEELGGKKKKPALRKQLWNIFRSVKVFLQKVCNFRGNKIDEISLYSWAEFSTQYVSFTWQIINKLPLSSVDINPQWLPFLNLRLEFYS